MGSQYCQPSDLLSTGVNPIALQDIPDSELQQACVQASALADSHFRGRYPLPLVSWGQDVVWMVAKVAVYIVLDARGMQPDLGADSRVRTNYEDAIAWLDGVQRQAVHPDVTPSVPSVQSPTYKLPQVITSQPRGWQQFSRGGKPVIG